MTTENKSKAPVESGAATDAQNAEADAGRRAALLRMGAYAASVAPAMLVLTSGKTKAQGQGNGGGGGGGNPQVDCENDAWQGGLSRAGHSGC